MRKGAVKVGVFIEPRLKRKLLNQEHLVRLNNLQKANAIAKTNLYFFSIDDVNFSSKFVQGTYYNTQQKLWEQKEFPLPDVFYNRLAGGLDKKKYRPLRDIILENNTKLLNTRGEFDKWEIYNHLSKSKEIQPYLPYTKKLEKYSTINKMLNKYNKIYLKDIGGRRGLGVLRVTKKNIGYELSFYKTKLEVVHFKTIGKLKRFIKRFFKGKEIIVQQAITSIIPNRSMDMRAEVQRNKYGELELVSISPRISKSKYPVMSSRTKPKILTFEQFTAEKLKLSKLEANNLKGELEIVLFNVYKRIEEVYGPFGELGIDVILDEKMKIWFIEANATSAKLALNKSYDAQTILRAYINPLEYAKLLIGAKA